MVKLSRYSLLLCALLTVGLHGDNHTGAFHRCSDSVMGGLATIIKDTVYVNRNVFSLTSAKVITATVPFYIWTRQHDESFHTNFYDKNNHKNINQMHSTACEAIEKFPFIGILAFSSLSLFARNEDLRTTSRVFAIGAASGLIAKNIIKECKGKHNLRPWNEHFSCEQRSQGGFPSGHMLEAAYMATVLGAHYGYKAAVPLSFFTAAMFAVSINCNRHYLSQAVAGTSLGIIYGLATHAVIDRRLNESWSCGVDMTRSGNPQLNVCYRF